jgi:hypothetical protein
VPNSNKYKHAEPRRLNACFSIQKLYWFEKDTLLKNEQIRALKIKS